MASATYRRKHPASVQYGRSIVSRQCSGNLSQPLPAIPGEQRPTRARSMVAREKGKDKTCSTARSRQGGSRRNTLLGDCFGVVSQRPQSNPGYLAMPLGLRNITNAFHMCCPVILHAAVMAQTESGGLVMLWSFRRRVKKVNACSSLQK